MFVPLEVFLFLAYIAISVSSLTLNFTFSEKPFLALVILSLAVFLNPTSQFFLHSLLCEATRALVGNKLEFANCINMSLNGSGNSFWCKEMEKNMEVQTCNSSPSGAY